MKYIVFTALICGIMTLYSCSSEKSPEPQKHIPAITLSPTEKNKLIALQNEFLNIENLANKAVRLAGEELKNVLKGGEISVSLPSIIGKAKMECLQSGELLAKRAIPDFLPPEATILLTEGKTGMVAAYKTYAESFEAIRSFVEDKNPMALLEYRKKSTQAQEQLSVASNKLKIIMTAAGVSQ